MFEHDKYCLDDEDWMNISGYEGIYQVSSFGRVRTVEGKQTETAHHGVRTWKGKIMKSRGSNPITGHRVGLWKDGKCTDFLVARLVCSAFLGVPGDPNLTVNHKDGNRFNNHMSNLEWLTLADNIRHGFATGLYPQSKVRRGII